MDDIEMCNDCGPGDCPQCELDTILNSAKDWIEDSYRKYGKAKHTCGLEQEDTEDQAL